MRVPGYCTECRRVRTVDATSTSVILGAPEGVCDECADAADELRRRRR